MEDIRFLEGEPNELLEREADIDQPDKESNDMDTTFSGPATIRPPQGEAMDAGTAGHHHWTEPNTDVRNN